MEIWKDIIQYEGLYKVSNLGNIKSIKKNIILSSGDCNGYKLVSLSKKGKQKTYYIHRIVGQHFVLNEFMKPQINHINGIKSDNRVKNLEWCTHNENMQHAFNIGLLNRKGENNSRSKLTKKQVLEIRKIYKEENITHKLLGQNYNVSKSTIHMITTNQRWKHL